MFDKYAEHLAHSMNDGSQWDGFDRGDTGAVSQGVEVIGRMPAIGGGKVEIHYAWYDCSSGYYVHTPDGNIKEFDNAEAAKTFARKFVAKAH